MYGHPNSEARMFRLRCFGRAAIEDPNGQEVRLRSQKHLGLLLYLAGQRGGRHGRKRLASLFWGTEPRLARHSLSQALYDITRCIPPLELHRTVREVGLGENGLAFDAEEFAEALREERLDEAVELYAGPFAPDLEAAGGEDFERWLDEERHRYRRLAETALLRHMSRCDDQARWGAMCLSATRLMKMNPLSEEAHRAYMRALWLQGDQVAAVSHFEAEAERLEKGLPGGIAEETHELVRRIRRSRPALATRAVRESPRLPMLGREHEFGELKRLLAETRDGEGRLAIVQGEAGMGKTRLLEEFHEFAALEGARVLESRCYSAETDVPFGPVVDGLRELARELSEDEEEQTTYFQLGHLFPEHFGATTAELDGFLGAGAGRRRLYEEVADLIRRSCDAEPIVWLIDDAHWMDASSTSLVHYLVRRLSGHPVMVVCTARDDASEFLASFQEWGSQHSEVELSELQLEGLNVEDVLTIIELLKRPVDPASLAPRVVKLTGGNPLYVQELIHDDVLEQLAAAANSEQRSIRTYGERICYSRRLSESLRRKVSGLSPPALRILEIVSVAGRNSDLKVITDTSGYTSTNILEILRDLYDRGILKDKHGTVVYAHDLLRSYVYNSLGEIQRSALHLTVAEVLADREECDEARALAHHFSEAGDTGRAYEYSLLSAQRAFAASAHEEAIHLAQLALKSAGDQADRAPALQVLADAEMAAGKLTAAEATLRDMLILQSHDSDRWLNTKLRLADLLLDRSRLNEAYQLLEQTVGQISRDAIDDSTANSIVWAEHLLIKAALKAGSFVSARRALLRLNRLVSDRRDPSVTMDATVAISRAAYDLHCGSPLEAVEHFRSANTWVSEINYELRIKATYIASMVYLRNGMWDHGEKWLDTAEELAHQYNDVSNLVGILNNKIVYALEKGEWANVEELIDRVSTESGVLDQTANASIVLEGNLAHARFFSGQTAEAIEHYNRVLERISNDENPGLVLQYKCCLGLAALQSRNRKLAYKLWSEVRDGIAETVNLRPEVQEYYKVLWLDTYFRMTEERSTEPLEELVAIAETERERDKPSALKIAWLAELLSRMTEDTSRITRSEMRALEQYKALQNCGMQWFAYSTNRWAQRAESCSGAKRVLA